MPAIPRLVADIGGTNARFALYVQGAIREELVLACADYPDIVTAIEYYLERIGAAVNNERPKEAAIAIAGPIAGDQIRMTNHSWQFSVAAVRQALRLDRFIVLNDFTALAMALPHLPPHELVQIGGAAPVGLKPVALIGPGTGLGVSGLVPYDGHWIPLQGEGGHVTLAPADEREMAVLKSLWEKYPHVSAERVLSGPGLVLLYETLCKLEGKQVESLTPAEIARRGRLGTDLICREVLTLFCAMLGTVAADLALTLGATGGVYIGGGIVPKLLEFFAPSKFRARFEAKGRYAEYLQPIPAWVIMTEQPALIGVASAFSHPGPRVVAE